jgi:hypothetical protein
MQQKSATHCLQLAMQPECPLDVVELREVVKPQ